MFRDFSKVGLMNGKSSQKVRAQEKDGGIAGLDGFKLDSSLKIDYTKGIFG